jgi:hypothetical protein
MEPASDILYPVVNNLDRIQLFQNDTDTNTNSTANHVVSILAATFYWRDILKNVLPPGKKGIVIVIDNPCTVSFTYQVE